MEINKEIDLPELPEGINIPMIELIHSGKDSYIPFMRKRKDGGGLENLCSIPRETLRSYFPELLKWLTQDSYMGVNSTYRPAPWRNRFTGLPDAIRGEGLTPGTRNELRYLNAVYVDLDVGRPDDLIKERRYPWLTAFNMAEIMMESGKLPQASIIARSGRGVYLLWLIRDPKNPNLPQWAGKEKIKLYKEVNRSLAFKLQKLAADKGAIDAARVLKVPGTIDSKSGNRVGYWIRLNEQGQPFIHSLEGLAEVLRSGSPERELPAGGFALPFYKVYPGADVRVVSEQGKGTCLKKLEGWRVRNFKRVKDLIKIEAWLQGFPEGRRRLSLTLLAEFLKGSGEGEAGIRSMLELKAARCRPPYPSDKGDSPLGTIIKNVWHGQAKLARSGNAALCRDYGITREVALELGLESIMPKDLMVELKAEIKAQDKQIRAAEKKAARAELRAAINRLWEGSGKNFSYRDLKAPLADEGFPVSHETIRKYLIELKKKQWG